MSKLRQSARGKDCEIRIPRICNGNPETVVLCHLPGGGMGTKSEDIHGAYGCSDCHDFVDGRNPGPRGMEWIMKRRKLALLEGMVRTQSIMLKEGLIQVS